MQALLHGVELEDGPAKCEKVEDGGGEEEAPTTGTTSC